MLCLFLFFSCAVCDLIVNHHRPVSFGGDLWSCMRLSSNRAFLVGSGRSIQKSSERPEISHSSISYTGILHRKQNNHPRSDFQLGPASNREPQHCRQAARAVLCHLSGVHRVREPLRDLQACDAVTALDNRIRSTASTAKCVQEAQDVEMTAHEATAQPRDVHS